MSKEAMKLALEALKNIEGAHSTDRLIADEAVKALEEALAKQEQGEPAMTVRVWRDKHGDQTAEFRNWHTLSDGEHSLYTTPQQRTWVGLTDDEIDFIYKRYKTEFFALKEVEARLKENNNA